MLVDDFTKKGFFKHLHHKGGRALVAYEEMGGFFDLLHQKQMMGTGERQLFCKLYDASGWINSTGMCASGGIVLSSLIREVYSLMCIIVSTCMQD